MEQQILAGDLVGLDEQTLMDYVRERRWFGSKTQEVTHAHVVDSVALRTNSPLLVCALVEIRFGPGTHELYQLLVGFRPEDEGWDQGVIAHADGWTVYDALADPVLARELVHMMRGETTLQAGDGAIEFRSVDLGAFGPDLSEPRAVGVEQSNSSVVFGDELILKAYRRLEAGINPELELVRFLTEKQFPNIAALVGWYAYAGTPVDATLGLLQEFIPGARDGWELALDEIVSEPEAFIERLGRLGEVTGAMHSTLASDSTDPEFAPEEPSAEALALLTATVDEQIEAVFVDLPQTDAVEPLAGRGEEVRDLLRMMTHAGSVGRVIRTHGDLHLGQVLWTGEDWIVLDFEGEPARSLPERRRKASPLRDVAGMLRSFAYAASASELDGSAGPDEGWEARAREAFLQGYFETVDRSLVPPGHDGRERLLAVFELEKAVYELRYELNNRPDWVQIPVAGVIRILEQAAA